MKKINYNRDIGFTKCRTDSRFQYCSYCGKQIGEGRIGLSIAKRCSTRLNIWICVNCIEPFADAIKKFKKEKMKEILLESL